MYFFKFILHLFNTSNSNSLFSDFWKLIKANIQICFYFYACIIWAQIMLHDSIRRLTGISNTIIRFNQNQLSNVMMTSYGIHVLSMLWWHDTPTTCKCGIAETNIKMISCFFLCCPLLLKRRSSDKIFPREQIICVFVHFTGASLM